MDIGAFGMRFRKGRTYELITRLIFIGKNLGIGAVSMENSLQRGQLSHSYIAGATFEDISHWRWALGKVCITDLQLPSAIYEYSRYKAAFSP